MDRSAAGAERRTDAGSAAGELIEHGPGYVRVDSGRSGAELLTASGELAGDAFGERVFGEMGMPPTFASLGDVDGDRVPDLLLAHPTNVVASGARMFDLRR